MSLAVASRHSAQKRVWTARLPTPGTTRSPCHALMQVLFAALIVGCFSPPLLPEAARASGWLSTGAGERGRILSPCQAGATMARGQEQRGGKGGRGLGQELRRVVSESLRRATNSRIPSNGEPLFALSVNRWPISAF